FLRTSETIGMAQRGGSVSSHIRIGGEGVSPVIPTYHADILIGFELAEAARQVPKLTKGSRCIVNIDKIVPTNVALKQGKYLEDEYLGVLRKNAPDGVYISGTKLALEAGDARTLNIVLLGAACGASMLPFSEEEIRAAIKECVKPKLLDMNIRAFELGIKEAERWRGSK
ncbi:MAG: indolepyruvate oxidoreductase subunit beta, partial [Synergistaceae bacterium]|nr:indolepyruvate oxidoreductase subunit beta [Synergistaceae bacterium]